MCAYNLKILKEPRRNISDVLDLGMPCGLNGVFGKRIFGGIIAEQNWGWQVSRFILENYFFACYFKKRQIQT